MNGGWDQPRPGWVCAECGFDYDATSPETVGARLDGLVSEYHSRLRADVEGLRTHPSPSTWSALEYACHTRDCLALYDWRIRAVLSDERPVLPQMQRDALAVERAYNESDPAIVADDLRSNRERLTALLGQLGPTDWPRVGVREGEELSVGWMANNILHEVQHHLMDIDQALAEILGPRRFT